MALRNNNTKQLSKADEVKVRKMFDKYANDPQDAQPGKIGPNGMARLLGELKLAEDDRQVLILAQRMNAETMCEFSWEEWLNGMAEMGAVSEATLRSRLSSLDQGLRDPAGFEPVYKFAFGYGKRPGSRNLDLDYAIPFWRILFKNEYSLLPLWEEFMEKVNKKAVTKDLWNQMFEFATTVKTDFSDYDEACIFDFEASWPTALDDFVNWARPRLNKKLYHMSPYSRSSALLQEMLSQFSIYYLRNPLKSELFQRFIPCMYLNAATFGILGVFDYHFMANILGFDVARFVHSSMICDIVHTSVRMIMFLEIFYTLFLISELFTQRFAWRVWFKLVYSASVCAFLVIIVIRHFWMYGGNCYFSADNQLFVDICIFFEVTGFIITLISLVVLKLDDEQRSFRFVLLIATAIELPECFIEVAFDRWHPIHAPSFMYFRMCAYGLFQLIFVAAVLQVGRKIKDQSKEDEMETAFGNPIAEDVYL